MRKTKKLCAWLLACVMVVSLLPGTALAAEEMKSGVASLTVNISKVAFAGYEWWVIGDETGGVYPQTNHITLLSESYNSTFGTTAFRTGSDESFEGSTQYSGGYFYANNPEGMSSWTTPNEYAGSTLQQAMESIANSFPYKEQAVISARDLASGATSSNNWAQNKNDYDYTDGIAGQGIAGQKLWAISAEEWSIIGNSTVLSYGKDYWLRSPSSVAGNIVSPGTSSGDRVFDYYVYYDSYAAARPALSLNLSSVLFMSAASSSGKSSAVGGSLTSMETISSSSTVKFTMQDSSQTLTVNATEEQSTQTGQTLYFTYSNATTGTNQYVSCVLTDNDGNVVYYGKLVDCEDSNAASGELSIPLTGVAEGTYTLKIFSEEANGDLYTDFCSEPVTMTVAVSNGSGTVSGFGGEVSGHSWSDEWSSDENYHWHECKADGCTVTDNSQKDGYDEHNFGWVIDKAATATEPGERHEECTVCGYEKAAEEIPATGTTTDETDGGDNSGTGTTTGSDTSTGDDQTDDGDNSDTSTGDDQTDDGDSYDTSTDDDQTDDGDSSDTSTGDDQTDDGDNSDTSTGDDQTDDSGRFSTGTTTDSADSTGDTASVQTGDDSNIALWIAVMLAAGAGLTSTILYSRKEKYSR